MRRTAPFVAALLLIAGAGSGVALEDRHRDEQARARAGQLTLLDAGVRARVGDLQRRIERLQRLAADSRQDVADPRVGDLLSDAAITAVGGLREVDGRLVPDTGPLPPEPGTPVSVALATPSALGAAERARDLGTPLSVTAPGSTGLRLLVFWPRYTTVSTPLTTTDRRARFSGWLVGLLSPEEAVAAPLAAAREAGLAPRLELAAGSGPGEAPPTAAGLSWRLVYAPLTASLSLFFWVPVGLGGLGLLGLLGTGRVAARRLRRSQRAHAEVSAQVRMLADLGASLQESLDLGSVLPGVLSRLAKELRLEHIGVATRDATGQFQQLFVLGNAGTGVATDWPTPSNVPLPAGVLAALPLRRDLRTIGRLTLLARSELDPSAQTALASTADLIAGAVGNAALYEREQATVRKLRDLDALKDSFLATVSHELRTPLTVLSGFTNLLNDRWEQLDDKQRRDAVARMAPHTRWLTSLVDDILDFITDRRDASPLRLAPLDLGEAVGRHLDELSSLMTHHTLLATLDPGVDVQSDPTAVQRIVANLVSNAAKFAPPGTDIAVRVTREGSWGVLAVSDRGPGISAEDQEHIFQRFYRGKSEAAQKTRGVGIGLAVVADWARQLGGQIAVESALGVGTTMTLRLPLRASTNAEIAVPA